MERNIFKRLYGKGMTYEQIRKAYNKKVLYDKAINKSRKKALAALEDEIRMQEENAKDGGDITTWINRLFQETWEDYYVDDKV